jgi:hypothetical protein
MSGHGLKNKMQCLSGNNSYTELIDPYSGAAGREPSVLIEVSRGFPLSIQANIGMLYVYMDVCIRGGPWNPALAQRPSMIYCASPFN